MQKQISDTAGKAFKEGLAKITINTVEGTLGTFKKDIDTMARMVISSINPGSYFQMSERRIDQKSGKGEVDMYVQRSELKTAFETLSHIIGKWNAQEYTDKNGQNVRLHEAEYALQSQNVNYVSGYVNLHGKKAQTRAKAEASELPGGKIIPSPTEARPDRFKFMLPAPDDISNSDREWVKKRRNAVFSGSMKLSQDEAVKRKQEAEEKELQRQINEVKKQKLELDKARLANARELQKLEKLEAKEKAELEDEVAKMLAYWDSKEAKEKELTLSKKEKEQLAHDKKEQELYDVFRKAELKEQEDQKKKEAREEAKAKADEAKKKLNDRRQEARSQIEKEHLQREELRKMRRLLMLIASGITIAVDIARRILTSMLNFSTKQLKDTIDANALTVPVTAVRNYGYFETAKGLEKGTIVGSIKDFQSAFGDVTALDEKKLEILARVMGSDVEKMVRSGLGGDNPAKLMELTFDKFFKQYLEGKNSLGQTVGQEQARRELVSVLNKISPQLSKMFALATYQHTEGINRDFSTWQEFFGTAPKTKALWFDEMSVNTFGEVINDIKAKLVIFRDDVLTKLSLSMSGFAEAIDNLRIGDNASTSLEKDAQNRLKHKKYLADNTKARDLAKAQLSQKLKKEYNMALPSDLTEENILVWQDLAMRFNEKQDVEGLTLLSQLGSANKRVSISEKELAKGPGETVDDYPALMSATAIASEVTASTRALYQLENAIDSDSSGNHFTERQMLREGTYDTKTTKSAMQTLFGAEDRAFFKLSDKGRWTWGEQASTDIGKGIVKALEKATKLKNDKLIQYLVASGADPVTLLGGTDEETILRAIEPYFGSKGYDYYQKAETAYLDKQEEDIGANVYAQSMAIAQGLIPNIVDEADLTYEANYNEQQLNVVVTNIVNGKKESKSGQFIVPNASTNNTYRFNIKSNEDTGNVDSLQIKTGQ